MTEWRDDDLDARLWEGQSGEQIAGDAHEPSTCNAAKEANKKLGEHRLLNHDTSMGTLQCYVTDLPMRFEKLGNIFLGKEIKHLHLVNDF